MTKKEQASKSQGNSVMAGMQTILVYRANHQHKESVKMRRNLTDIFRH